MIKLDLNNFPETSTCGELARWLIAEKGHYPNELIQFMRGETKVFTKNYKLSYWAGTAVEESTKGEWMKTVPYRGDFQLKSPTELASGVGVKLEDNPTYQTAH